MLHKLRAEGSGKPTIEWQTQYLRRLGNATQSRVSSRCSKTVFRAHRSAVHSPADVDRLIAQARKELQGITSQEAWRNGWTGEGNIPDYSKLLHRLERLVELGHADAVARLGREIIERGLQQVGQAHDEGETAMELSRCLPVVFDAVAKSSLAPAQKLLFAVDAKLKDDHDVIGDASNVVFNGKHRPADWSAVADDLARRLSSVGTRRRKSHDDGDTKVQTASDWPLPVPEYLIPLLRSEVQMRRSSEPHFDVMIDMAIADERPDEVLHWYDKMCAEQKPSPYGNAWNGPGAHADDIAAAVARSHPQRSLEIYRQRVEQHLKQTGHGAYETVASYLRKMQPIMKSIDREKDWKQLVDDIQIRYRNRPKLMEILERLGGKPILAIRKPLRLE